MPTPRCASGLKLITPAPYLPRIGRGRGTFFTYSDISPRYIDVYTVRIMLELAILGLLKEQELHGYELKKRLSDRLGFGSGVSFGSLYPALARLERAGAVKAVEASGSVGTMIPLTGSLGGELAAYRVRKTATRGSRGKKVYGITE